jgi:hypothetical protein
MYGVILLLLSQLSFVLIIKGFVQVRIIAEHSEQATKLKNLEEYIMLKMEEV